MRKIRTPFLFVNPKSYLCGKKNLDLAKAVDEIASERNIDIFYTCPFVDIRLIAENCNHLIVTAQNMDALNPGRGMGAILPESLVEAGAESVVLNHAENQKTLSELYKCIQRARKLGLVIIVCTDSLSESLAAANLGADVILAEPTELIGTGRRANDDYTVEVLKIVKSVATDVKVMIASGITTAEDCYKVVYMGADGTGSTSGIVNAANPARRVEEMVDAIIEAYNRRTQTV